MNSTIKVSGRTRELRSAELRLCRVDLAIVGDDFDLVVGDELAFFVVIPKDVGGGGERRLDDRAHELVGDGVALVAENDIPSGLPDVSGDVDLVRLVLVVVGVVGRVCDETADHLLDVRRNVDFDQRVSLIVFFASDGRKPAVHLDRGAPRRRRRFVRRPLSGRSRDRRKRPAGALRRRRRLKLEDRLLLFLRLLDDLAAEEEPSAQLRVEHEESLQVLAVHARFAIGVEPLVESRHDRSSPLLLRARRERSLGLPQSQVMFEGRSFRVHVHETAEEHFPELVFVDFLGHEDSFGR